MSLFNRFVVLTLPLVPKPLVRRVASRYVAGATRDEAIAEVKRLNDEGVMATLDVLGEEVSERERAEAAVREYTLLYDAIDAEDLDANVSIKLTMLGLKIDEDFCCDQVEQLARTAAGYGNFLRIDMEDRTTTDATLRIYHKLQPRYGNLGVVFQAYMRRTLADIGDMPAQGANVRLCKGVYIEPRTVAWKGYDTVRLNFVRALDKLFRNGVYVGIATHDEYLVCAAAELIDRYEVPMERYEFQMLRGVDTELRQILLDAGHRVRVYIPYGRDWYAYSTRRLRENPEVAGHIMRSMFGLKK